MNGRQAAAQARVSAPNGQFGASPLTMDITHEHFDFPSKLKLDSQDKLAGNDQNHVEEARAEGKLPIAIPNSRPGLEIDGLLGHPAPYLPSAVLPGTHLPDRVKPLSVTIWAGAATYEDRGWI